MLLEFTKTGRNGKRYTAAYNINYWLTGADNDWYEYRIEIFDDEFNPDRVTSDITILIETNDTVLKFISDKRLADYASRCKPGDRIRLMPQSPFKIIKSRKGHWS